MRGLAKGRKQRAKEDARARRSHKGRTPDPNADAVCRAAERAERQAGKREAVRQLEEET
jgi:hypothetical protein